MQLEINVHGNCATVCITHSFMIDVVVLIGSTQSHTASLVVPLSSLKRHCFNEVVNGGSVVHNLPSRMM